MEENKAATGTETPTGAAAPPAEPPVIVSSTVPAPPEAAAPAAPPAEPPVIVSSTVPAPPPPPPAPAAYAPPPPPPPAAPPPPPAPAVTASDKPAAAPTLLPGVSAPPPGFDYVGFVTKLPLSGQMLLGGGLLGVIGTIVNGAWSSPATYLMFVLYLSGPLAVWVLYQSAPNPMQKMITWAIGQVGAVVLGFSVIAIISSLSALGYLFSVGFIIGLVGNVAFWLGSFLKAKEEKLI